MLVIILFVNKFYLIVVDIGGPIGNVLALSIGGLMCSWHFAGGWPLIFYSAGRYECFTR
jgi:hypothetical protein